MTVLWQYSGETVAAFKVGWLGFVVTLVLVHVPPLTSPHKGRVVEAGLLPTDAAALLELGAVLELGAMLELLDPQYEPVLLVGDFNALTAALTPTVVG